MAYRDVIIEDNHATMDGDSLTGGGGVCNLGLSNLYLHGVSILRNSAFSGGGLYAGGTSLTAADGSGSLVIDNVTLSDNIGRGDGGGAMFFGVPGVVFSQAVFSNNTAQNGGAACFESGTGITMKRCSIINNKALRNGGAIYGNGKDTVIHLALTMVEGNSALDEGGAIFVLGLASLKLNQTIVNRCVAGSHGGGLCTRDDSVLTMANGAAIRNCESVKGMGGGALVGGESLTVSVAHDTPVLIEKNKAMMGGGLSFMGLVALDGKGTTRVVDNLAHGNGGGLYGFSSFGRLIVSVNHKLYIEVLYHIIYSRYVIGCTRICRISCVSLIFENACPFPRIIQQTTTGAAFFSLQAPKFS